MQYETVKVMDRDLFKRVNERAIAKGFNRTLKRSVIDNLPNATFPVLGVYEVGESHVRCQILMNQEDTCIVDVPLDMFEHMPERKIRVA